MSDPNTSLEPDEAQAILEALRQIQDNPELQAEAWQNPKVLLDRLNLSSIDSAAVTRAIAGLTAPHATKPIVHECPGRCLS
jgi:7-keto-8-aminopelargonate synthetase-like enzyme